MNEKPESESLYSKFTRAIAKAVGLISPAKAVKYLGQHACLRAYDAAVISGHHNEFWTPQMKTGDLEIGRDWKTAVARSRDLDRNHPLVNDALRVGFAFTVGSALDPQWTITKDGKRDTDSIKMLESAFWEWAEDCTINGLHWDDVKRLVYRHLKVDGELFVIESADEFHPYKLQLVEPEQLNDSIDGDLKNGNYAIRGIEFNKRGRAVFYHFYEAHPSGLGLSDTTVKVDARRVMHIFMPGRITETRGICHFVSAIMSLYDQNELSDQILELHRLAAAYGIFITSPSAESNVIGLPTTQDSSGRYVPVKTVGGVRVNYLNAGEDPKTVNPEMPTGSFSEFDKSYLRKGARGFSMSYETFTGDFSNANFSTLKAGQNNERALFRLDSALIIRKFSNRVIRNWMDAAVINGLRLKGYWQNRKYFQQYRFTLPALPAADAVKEEVADRQALENRTTSRRIICERKGIDYDELVDELKQEEIDLALASPADDKKQLLAAENAENSEV
jgi:lambda family phage portal protein